MTEVALIVIAGFFAGLVSGVFGVGGGILYIPALVFVGGLSQLHAQATSLAAMLPVVVLGTWQQKRYDNVRWRPAAVIGLVSAGGVAAGAALAASLPEGILRKLFAVFLLVVAGRLAASVVRARREDGLPAAGEEV